VFSILAERGVGPKLYAVFPGGRLEEYLPCRTLTTSDLPISANSNNIAKCTAEYHLLKMPVKKEPTHITSKLFSYLANVKEMRFNDLKSHQLYMKIIDHNLDDLAQFVTKMITSSEEIVVFCHNDIQEGNLLHTTRTDGGNPIQMIDFEYSSYNYRGFDIANHFCEWMYDYSHSSWPYYSYNPNSYPNRTQQVNFIETYLRVIHKDNPDLKQDPKWSIDYVVMETRRFAMMSHLFWALWSVVQAKISDIGFGYLEYSLTRLSSLQRQREEWGL